MTWERRLGSGILAGLGIIFISLMVYVLLLEHLIDAGKSNPRTLDAIDIAVFFVERSEWRIFQRGLVAALSEPRNLGRIVAEDDEVLVVETAKHHRLLRFSWISARGECETANEAEKLVRSSPRPIAVVGSSNTVLTTALAEALHIASEGDPAFEPVLLVPWATSQAVLEREGHRGYRFCSNNKRAADLIVDCVHARQGLKPPRQALILIDRYDPYSVDLARSFREAILRVAPGTVIQERADVLSTAARGHVAGGIETPTSGELEFARSVWASATLDPSRPTWLILPVQGGPIRRIFSALNSVAPSRVDSRQGSLTAICGDSIGLTTFESLLNALAFPVWGLSGGSYLGSTETQQLGDDVQVLAEIALVLVTSIDHPGELNPEVLRKRLTQLKLGRTDYRAFGRSISFLETGERAWETDEDCLLLEPGSSKVFFLSRDATGVWSSPRPVDNSSSARSL